MPPLVFKPLGRDNVIVNPFTVSKNQALTFTSGGNAASNSFSIASAIDFSDPNSFSPNTAVTNSDGTYQSLLFKSVEHIFYTSGALSGSADFAAGGSGIRDFPLSGSVYVINIPQPKFGEGIRPGTFEMSDPNDLSTSSVSIVDDAQGRLVISGTTSVVGNIFYDLGVAVVLRNEWSPLQLPELWTWTEADTLTGYSSGSPVSATLDLSGNSRPFIQNTLANKPSYDTAVLNGLPGLRFVSGSPSFMTTAQSFSVTGSAGIGWTSAAVIVVRSVVGNQFFMSQTGVLRGPYQPIGHWEGYDTTILGARRATNTHVPVIDTAHIIIAAGDNSSSVLYLDGVKSIDSLTGSLFDNPSPWHLGMGDFQYWANAHICAGLIMNGKITDADAANLRTFWNNKWAVS